MQGIENLVELGKRLSKSEEVMEKIATAENKNTWFVPRFVFNAFDGIINQMLNEQKLKEWINRYQQKETNKTIGLIFAGNLPLVGFHDFLCCYVTGCKMKIKLSSKDDELFPFILKLLFEIAPDAKNKIEIINKLENFDAVIATGSNNTHRYFEYYFRDYPKILRNNRNSVAVLTGEESVADLEKLAVDIFMYFGFGCRNVSKLFVPVGYDVTQLFSHFEKNYKWLHSHNKYMNNYDYQRTILMLNKSPHLANEFVMLVENNSISSPIATLNYEFWSGEKIISTELKTNAAKIQCIVSKNAERWNSSSAVNFGESQKPQLGDYADGIDTLKFLFNL